MPSFTISNHQQNYLIFTFTIIFWFVCEVYCFCIISYKQDIKSNCLIISFKRNSWKTGNVFQSFIPAGNSIPSQLYWLIRCSIFDILSGWFSMFSWFNATVVEYWKHLLSLFFGFIVLLLFITHSRDFIYYFPFFRLVLWTW